MPYHVVAEVKNGAGESTDLQLREEVMDGIDQEINSCESAGEEGAPLPVIVLRRHIHKTNEKIKRDMILQNMHTVTRVYM